MATVTIDFDSQGDVELILGMGNMDQSKQDQTQSTLSNENQASPETCNLGLVDLEVKQFRFRASSLKLTSSSQYFKAMLEGAVFNEGKELKEKRFVKIELLEPDDDIKTMIIILAVIHDDIAKVPLKIDFQLLVKIAVLVDKYLWHELMTSHATAWLDKLLKFESKEDNFDDELLTKLWIAWLFGMKIKFKRFSRVALLHTISPIHAANESNRLPTKILEAMNEQRIEVFAKVEDALSGFSRVVSQDLCNNKDAMPEKVLLRCMVLGQSTFCFQELQLGNFASPNHNGASVVSLRDAINLIQSAEGYNVKGPMGGVRNIIPGNKYDLKHLLQQTMSDLNMDDLGLNYENFKS